MAVPIVSSPSTRVAGPKGLLLAIDARVEHDDAVLVELDHQVLNVLGQPCVDDGIKNGIGWEMTVNETTNGMENRLLLDYHPTVVVVVVARLGVREEL